MAEDVISGRAIAERCGVSAQQINDDDGCWSTWQPEVLRMAENLSDIKGLKIHCIFRGSLKRKMIKANKVFSDYVILFGEEEFTQKRIVLKDLSSGEQQIISLDKTFEYINGIATKIK